MIEKIKWTSIAGSILLAFFAGWKVNEWLINGRIETEKREQVESNYRALKTNTEQVNNVATGHVIEASKLEKRTGELKKELKNVQTNNPLPAGCRIDADRLHILTKAVRSANEAASGQ